jgi:NADP-reducing hydrogenase subunit HndB
MKSLEELKALRDKLQGDVALREGSEGKTKVLVGMATCGIAAGARPVLAGFVEEVAKRGLKDVQVGQTGCIGICQYEPVVEVLAPGREKVTYVNMSPDKVARIVQDHLVGGNIVQEYTIGSATK